MASDSPTNPFLTITPGSNQAQAVYLFPSTSPIARGPLFHRDSLSTPDDNVQLVPTRPNTESPSPILVAQARRRALQRDNAFVLQPESLQANLDTMNDNGTLASNAAEDGDDDDSEPEEPDTWIRTSTIITRTKCK
jgi:hypothetical protein